MQNAFIPFMMRIYCEQVCPVFRTHQIQTEFYTHPNWLFQYDIMMTMISSVRYLF